jgi:uncharacterized Ntn-hydrolase superfamily protein
MKLMGLVGRVGQVGLVGLLVAGLVTLATPALRGDKPSVRGDKPSAFAHSGSADRRSLGGGWSGLSIDEQPTPPPVATFSILGFDPATGEIGGAVQSRVFSVGNGVLWGEAGVGMVATQAIIDVSYGPKGLALLRAGMAPESIIKAIWDSDPDPRPDQWTKQGRQFAVIDTTGKTGVYTGPKATEWAGHKQGKFCTAQGNILAGDAVVAGMVKAFEETQGHISLRLMAALDAGQAAGGDKRGMQSAAMLIVQKGGGVWLNNDTVLRLQVDDSPEPFKEMRRLVESWNDRRTKGQQRPVK